MLAKEPPTSAVATPQPAGHRDGFAGELAAQEDHRSFLNRRGVTVAFAAFTVYAAIAALTTAGQDRVWALWALPGYGAAAVLLWRGRGWTPALPVAVALALIVPLISLSATWPLTAGMVVIGRSADLLLRDGLPYLPPEQLTSWLSYNPYLPVMALFGMPRAAGLTGLAGHPGVWMALATVVLLAAAAWFVVPHPPARCPECRRDVLRLTAVAAASPVIALNLAVITTDPPVLALMLLAFALAARPSGVLRAGLVLGVGCALKVTAWPEIPVLAAMFWSRDGARAAARFTASSVVTAAVLIAALAPGIFVKPSAIIQNAVLFPLGLTRHKTPAESMLPGHLLASTGSAGHLLAVVLLLAAATAVLASLVVRPPRDVNAAALRLAIGLAAMFTLGPNDRFGYFVYPLGLLGWPALTGRRPAVTRAVRSLASGLTSNAAGRKGTPGRGSSGPFAAVVGVAPGEACQGDDVRTGSPRRTAGTRRRDGHGLRGGVLPHAARAHAVRLDLAAGARRLSWRGLHRLLLRLPRHLPGRGRPEAIPDAAAGGRRGRVRRLPRARGRQPRQVRA